MLPATPLAAHRLVGLPNLVAPNVHLLLRVCCTAGHPAAGPAARDDCRAQGRSQGGESLHYVEDGSSMAAHLGGNARALQLPQQAGTAGLAVPHPPGWRCFKHRRCVAAALQASSQPGRVHFLWASRQPREICMLDGAVLEAAR